MLYIKKHLLRVFFLLFAGGLVACSNDFLPELSIDTVSIYTDGDTNQNSAIAVDLVIIYDDELAKTIGKMSAAKYFSSSTQLLLDNPTLLDIWHWELVPGQIVQDFTPPQDQGDAYAAFVFANYLTDGDHRIKVAPHGVVKVLLLKDDLKNIAVLDDRGVRAGTTVTDVPRKSEAPDEESEVSPQMKLGPTKDLMGPCKKRGPKQVQKVNKTAKGKSIVCPTVKKPLPIITRPLAPPCRVTPKTYPKVKVN